MDTPGDTARTGEEASYPIDWIDSFAREIRPHVEVRREDSLLILVPNQAYRLNTTGVEILARTLEGESIRAVLGPLADDPARRAEVHAFFCDVRALLMGCLGEGRGRRSVEVVPYRTPFNRLPVLSEFAPTYRCNLSCRFCYAGSPGGSPWPELDTGDALKILRIVREDAKVPGLSFTGGEPTLRDDLEDLVAGAVGLGLRVNLITNGTLLSADRVQGLKRAGLRSAQVSLEGPSPLVHDELVASSGAFGRTIKGIEALRDAGIPVHTNTTMSRGNRECLEEIVDLAAELGMTRLSMNMVIPCGTASETGRDLWVRYDEVGAYILKVKRRARERGLQFFWYAPTPYCLFNPIAEGLGNKGCAACDGLLSVAPDGSVLPCSSLMEPVGNLLREPFDRVWGSAEARAWRLKSRAPEPCRTCELLEPCTGACPIYWRAVGEDELSAAKAKSAE